MNIFRVNHPAFRPVWVRATMVTFTLGWALLEFLYASAFWGMIFLGAGLYLVWGFFIVFDPKDYERAKDPATPTGDDDRD